jgi:hypothetical protein
MSKYGWSEDFSPELSTRTAIIPSTIPSLTFSTIDLLNVRIGWG